MHNSLALITVIPYFISLAAVVATFYGIKYTNKTNRDLQSDKLRSEEHKQNNEMLRSKGEELVMLLASFKTSFQRVLISTIFSLRNNETVVGNSFDESNNTLLKVAMFVQIYFIAAESYLHDLVTRHQKLTHLIANFSESSKSAEEVANELIELGGSIEKHSTDLQKQIIGLLRNLHADG